MTNRTMVFGDNRSISADVAWLWINVHTPDLVVCGTRGFTGLKRLRVGSTAAVLAHVTPSSLLVACDPLADA